MKTAIVIATLFGVFVVVTALAQGVPLSWPTALFLISAPTIVGLLGRRGRLG